MRISLPWQSWTIRWILQKVPCHTPAVADVSKFRWCCDTALTLPAFGNVGAIKWFLAHHLLQLIYLRGVHELPPVVDCCISSPNCNSSILILITRKGVIFIIPMIQISSIISPASEVAASTSMPQGTNGHLNLDCSLDGLCLLKVGRRWPDLHGSFTKKQKKRAVAEDFCEAWLVRVVGWKVYMISENTNVLFNIQAGHMTRFGAIVQAYIWFVFVISKCTCGVKERSKFEISSPCILEAEKSRFILPIIYSFCFFSLVRV